MVMERLEVEATFKDELTARLDNALSTMVEFGATTEQITRAQEKLFSASKDGKTIIAQQANVLRTLADETEDAEVAMSSMAQAFELAAVTGEKAEDAGRKLGRLLKGDTSVLRAFDAQARRVADAIDKMADPAERASAAQRELTRAMRRQKAASSGLIGATRKLDVSLAKVGLSTRNVAAATAAVAAAMGAASAKALNAYIQDHAALSHQAQQLAKDNDALERSVGRLVSTLVDADAQMDLMSTRVKGLTALVNSLAKRFEEANASQDSMLTSLLKINLGHLDMLSNISALNVAMDPDGPIIGFFDELVRVQGTLDNQRGSRFADMATEITHYHEIARAARAAAAAEADRVGDAAAAAKLRKDQLASGQISVDPMTGAETQFAGPAPFSGAFNPGGRGGGRRGGGGGGRKGPRPGSFAAIEADARARSIGPADLSEFSAGISASLNRDQMAPLSAQAGTASAALAQGLPALRENLALTKTAIREMQSEAAKVDAVFTDLANGGIALAGSAISGLAETLAAGEASLASFGRALLSSLGDLITQAGQAFLLLGAGVENIKTGITSPAALIAIGVGMLALGGALKGFAARGQDSGGRAGGGTAQALERFGRRLFDREVGQESREVTINIEGRSMRGFVLDVAADGARRGQISPLTPVRRT